MITYFENSYVLMIDLGLIFAIIALDLIVSLFIAESEVRMRLLFGIVLVQIGDVE
jgi:cytochrome c oxidase subunit IV